MPEEDKIMTINNNSEKIKLEKNKKKKGRKFKKRNISEDEISEDNDEKINGYPDNQDEDYIEGEENAENINDENYNQENDDYSDLMKYNDKNFKKQKIYDEDYNVNKKNIPRANNQQQIPVKLSYHEKLSQKDLLYEAIFTELYNIKSLEDMQRLEELNKRDVNYSNKKQFPEYIKVIRRIKKTADVIDPAVFVMQETNNDNCEKVEGDEKNNNCVKKHEEMLDEEKNGILKVNSESEMVVEENMGNSVCEMKDFSKITSKDVKLENKNLLDEFVGKFNKKFFEIYYK